MQCHKCPLNGHPTEQCLTCNAAEYLDNGFKTIIPVDDIQKVNGMIDKSYSASREKSEPLIKNGNGKTERNVDDCKKVLDVLKKCDSTSFKHIACIVAIFMTLGSNSPMLSSVLDEETFVQYAEKMEVSKQYVSKTWNKMVDENPILGSIKSGKMRKRMYL